MPDRRRTFGPVVLGGLAAAVLATVAATRPWVEGSSGRVDTGSSAYAAAIDITAAQESPLAAALGLVLLACWGVVLVTRGAVRRVVAALGALAALGLVVTAAVAFRDLQDSLARALMSASGEDTAVVHVTAWWAAALVAGLLSLVATAAAVLLAPSWPEMGSRYDAPSGTAADQQQPEGNLDIWRAIDEGRDPTE
ncbi:hypothetical protein DDE18_15480 [Nocardioides gansuensis]|uniref:Trp biosynthesis protein n=1 Tax=Nocardioides gansuensis TaxID=2138300 RepID=A0A2T8F8N7_9ACTN|nr:Trp biosynthesis-associated membrane protein [Nocardioides gansuensis]PVG82082.1 hypothetical protein DDE18_15480 [Nocardioides gansuensis]